MNRPVLVHSGGAAAGRDPGPAEGAVQRFPLQLVTQGAVITTFQTTLFPLAFARGNQVFQAARSLRRRFAAFRAALIPLHPKLVFALARNGQLRELVQDAGSHTMFGLTVSLCGGCGSVWDAPLNVHSQERERIGRKFMGEFRARYLNFARHRGDLRRVLERIVITPASRA